MALETKLLKNTETFAEAMVRCGVRYHFAYPITPASDVMKRSAAILPGYGGKMIQMESEPAVANALAGCACTGRLAAASSAGPGMSLMQETLSFMAAGELPGLFLDCMRVGPGDGDIIGAQSNYYQATRGGGHGDYRTIVLAPASGQEIVGLMPGAIRLAFQYRNPVLFVMDGVTAQMTESVTFTAPQDHTAAFDTSGWRFTGTKDHPKRFLLTGSYTHAQGEAMNERLRAKYADISSREQVWEETGTEDAELLVVAFGIHGRMARDLVADLRALGHRAGLIRPITLWPFPDKAFAKLPDTVRAALVVEMNHGQMVDDVKICANGRFPVHFLGKTGGDLPMCTLKEITKTAHDLLGQELLEG